MSGELQTLLLVLLTVAVGAAAFLYYLRKRMSASYAEPAPSEQVGSTSRDRDATEADHKQEVPPLPETGSRDEAPGTPDVSDEETEKQAAAAALDHEDVAVLDESASQVEPGLRLGDGAEGGEPISGLHEKPRTVPSAADKAPAPDEAPHEEFVVGGGRQAESTISQAESEEVTTPGAAQGTKEVPPDVAEAAAHGNAPEEGVAQAGFNTTVTTEIPESGVETHGVGSARTADQPETKEGHEATGVREALAHLPVESATPATGREGADSINITAPSSLGGLAAEELDKGLSTGEEQPPKAADRDEVPGLTDQDDSVRKSSPESMAGNDLADSTVGETAEYDVPSEKTDVVEDEHVSRDQEVQDDVLPVPPPDGGTQSGADSLIAVTGATAVSKEPDGAPGNESVAGAEVPVEAKGAKGAAAGAGSASTSDAKEAPGPGTEEEECGSAPEDEEHEVAAASNTQAPRKKRAKTNKPRKYTGLARAAPQTRDSEPEASRAGSVESTRADRSLPIEVRLRFERGGFCNVSLIAKRSAGLPENITVAAQSADVDLRAMQDEWYQDVVPDDISRLLRDGTVWTQEGANGQCTWSLSGRVLYVLADRSDISGYVSQACLALGRDHAVLCSELIRSRVEEAILEAGAEPTAVLDESLGVPQGWIVLRGVVPKTPVAPVGEADIFNALRPLPRIEISLEQGIRLEYANWLEGHPPLIRVYGDPEHAAEVRIDGQVAAFGADGAYRAPGWDSIGSHSIWCSGIRKSYSVVPFVASWERWDAYAFPITYGSERSIAICGPLVRTVSGAAQSPAFSVSVPEVNPALLGQTPGQHALAANVSGLRGTPLIASPSFRPVWALPRDPLHCDKHMVSVLLVGEMAPPEAAPEDLKGKGAGSDRDVDEWCRLILDANRKGLKTQPDTEPVRALWLRYKRLARRIWRAHK